MLKESYPYYLANEPHAPNTDLEVTDKYTGEVATRVAMADRAAIDAGIAATVEATDACRAMAHTSFPNLSPALVSMSQGLIFTISPGLAPERSWIWIMAQTCRER